MNSGALTNVTVVTMNPGRDILINAGIVWEDSEITFIGTNLETKRYANSRNICIEEKNGEIVFPGLINTHMHIFQNLLKGLGADLTLESWWPQTIKPSSLHLREKHIRAAGLGAALEGIRSGTTTMLDYMQVHPVPGLSDILIDSLSQVGIRTLYGRGFRNTGAKHGFPPELIEKTEDVFADIMRLKEKYEKDDDMVKIWIAPAAIWALDGEGLKDTRDFAEDKKIPITMHMYETRTDDIVCQERYGVPDALTLFQQTGFLGEDLLAVHVVAVGEQELKAFQDKGVKISHNPVSNMYLASGVCPVSEMLKRDLTVSLGTDGAASNNSVDMLETLKFAALLQKVHRLDPTAISANKVLELATIDAAKAVGMEKRIGSLEVGKKADLFVFNPYHHGKSCPCHDPVATLVYSSGQDAVEKVVINGKTVLNKGEFTEINEIKVFEDQQEMAEELISVSGYPEDFLKSKWK